MSNQMYVPQEFQVTKCMLKDHITSLGDAIASAQLILMVDYVYHHDDADYDGGLSFLDRLYKKLHGSHPNWNVNDMKDMIRNANDKHSEYMDMIENMLMTESDRVCYGL